MAEETKETKKIIPESKKKHKKKHKKKKVLLKVSVVFLLLVVIGWFTFGAKVMKLRSEAKKLVAQSSEETFKASQTSIVYDTNGKQLLKFKGEKDVYYLKYKELPVYVIAAVISVEDKNFYNFSLPCLLTIQKDSLRKLLRQSTSPLCDPSFVYHITYCSS